MSVPGDAETEAAEAVVKATETMPKSGSIKSSNDPLGHYFDALLNHSHNSSNTNITPEKLSSMTRCDP